MLGETEEYEPLSRAAYYHAMREQAEHKIEAENKSKT
jgi:thymidine kinase